MVVSIQHLVIFCGIFSSLLLSTYAMDGETGVCMLSPVHKVQSCIDANEEVFVPIQTVVVIGTTCIHHVCDVLKFAVCGKNGIWEGRDGDFIFPNECLEVQRPNVRRPRFLVGTDVRILFPISPQPPTPDCGHPGAVPNVDISISKTTQGGTATYTCQPGYEKTSGDSVRTCQSNRAWSGSKPYCAYMTSCDSGPCQNGATCTNVPDNYYCTCPEIWQGTHCEQVAYVCARNLCQHANQCIDGADMYTCSCQAGWSGHNCDIPADCGQPEDIYNGQMMVVGTTIGYAVAYSCDYNYNMTTGAATCSVLFCQANATWSGAPPMCVFVNSCGSDPCQNAATCINGLGDYTCICTNQWSGVNCETDIQPPLVTGCSSSIHVNATSSTALVTWTHPTFVDPLGNDVDVTCNYEMPEYEFPWGDFTVQYVAVKPLNGLTAECVFIIHVRPTPCDELNVPLNGGKLCNGWRKDFGQFCLVTCVSQFSISPGHSYDQWYVCGASGQWMAPGPLPDCEVAVSDASDILTYHPDYPSYTFTSCDNSEDVDSMKHLYLDRLGDKNGFGAFCSAYGDECHVDNVVVEC